MTAHNSSLQLQHLTTRLCLLHHNRHLLLVLCPRAHQLLPLVHQPLPLALLILPLGALPSTLLLPPLGCSPWVAQGLESQLQLLRLLHRLVDKILLLRVPLVLQYLAVSLSHFCSFISLHVCTFSATSPNGASPPLAMTMHSQQKMKICIRLCALWCAQYALMPELQHTVDSTPELKCMHA